MSFEINFYLAFKRFQHREEIIDDRTAIIAARVDLMHAIELWEREREHAYSVRAGSASPRMEAIGGQQA